MKYRKKPVVVEAAVWDGIHVDPLWELDPEHTQPFTLDGAGHVTVRTIEGPLAASPGDWIIKGVKGEFYPCKPDIFAMTYEVAE